MKITREIKLFDSKYCDECPCLCRGDFDHCGLGYWNEPEIAYERYDVSYVRPAKCIEENGE